MTDNLRIWSALEKTDPKHTKNFKRGGGFTGTAMKPIWLTKRLTELFGPCGVGWGMLEPKFQVVNANDEILVYCTVALWYNESDKHSNSVYGVGGDKVMGKNKYGPFTNDEAFKASYTDALSNAMKQIGVGADIHMGLFDDEKYVRETARAFAEPDPVKSEADQIYAEQSADRRKQGLEPLRKPKPTRKEWAGYVVDDLLLSPFPSVEALDDWLTDPDREEKIKQLAEENHSLWQSIQDAAKDRRRDLQRGK